MNKFSEKWASLSKSQRRKAKHDAVREAHEATPTNLKMCCTSGQLKAMAKTRVDMAFAIALRVA